MAEVDVMRSDSINQLTRAEISLQIEVARQYPRNLQRCQQEAIALATSTEDVAKGCFYRLERDGKAITGGSIRLAEILAHSWEHIRVASRIIDIDEHFVTAQAICIDLQRNVAFAAEVKRRITTREGRRYSEDMIQTTAQAASAISRRNVVFSAIPEALWMPVYIAAVRRAIGDAKTLIDRREKMLVAFGKMGVRPQQILDYFGVATPEAITIDHVERALGIFNAIRDGEQTIEQAFPAQAKSSEGQVKSAPASAAPPATPAAAEAPPAEPSPAEAPTDSAGVGSYVGPAAPTQPEIPLSNADPQPGTLSKIVALLDRMKIQDSTRQALFAKHLNASDAYERREEFAAEKLHPLLKFLEEFAASPGTTGG